SLFSLVAILFCAVPAASIACRQAPTVPGLNAEAAVGACLQAILGGRFSHQVQRVALEVVDVDDLEAPFVGCRQHHAGRDACLEGLLPAGGAQAPAISRFQTRES